MNIVVIGSINVDLVINTSKLPQKGETVSGNGFSVNCGGKGVNQAVAAAKLGGNVTFIGAVGNDEYGNVSIENLNKSRVNTENIIRTDVNTGVAVITVCNGDNSIPLETVTYAAALAHSAGVKVILNPAPVMDLPCKLLENTDIMILNETEAEFLTKIYPDSQENRKKCLNKLNELGIKTIVLTLGENGSVYTDGGNIKHQEAVKTTVVDTTAAGDTFIGAFCMKMNDNIEYAVKYSTSASSLTVSREGASKSIPTDVEVVELMNSIK